MAFMACIRKYVSEFFFVHALQTPVYTQYTRTITVKKKNKEHKKQIYEVFVLVITTPRKFEFDGKKVIYLEKQVR